MIFFSHEALLTRIIHSKFLKYQNKSQLVMTLPVLAATHFGPLGPLGVNICLFHLQIVFKVYGLCRKDLCLGDLYLFRTRKRNHSSHVMASPMLNFTLET
jgi:hypothetical protein